MRKYLLVILLILWLLVPYASSNNWIARVWRVNIGWLDSDFAGTDHYHGLGRLKVAWNDWYGTAARYNWTDREWRIVEEQWPVFGFEVF